MAYYDFSVRVESGDFRTDFRTQSLLPVLAYSVGLGGEFFVVFYLFVLHPI